MKFLALPQLSPRPKSTLVQPLSLLLAAILLVMVAAQLFKYEELPSIIASLGLGVGESMIAALVVILEVAALPYLLFMKLSPLARFLSMISGWGVVGWWVIATLTGTFGGASNIGFLGGTIELPSGWWSVFLALSLAVLATWVSWGMWSGAPKKN